MNPHKPVSTQAAAICGASNTMANATPSRLTQPTPQPTPTTMACTRSGTGLRQISCQNRPLTHIRPTVASAKPKSAIRVSMCAPANHSHQPPACSSRGVSNWRTSGGATWSHLGPAVNMKPEKKSGMKPKLMTAPCARDGDMAYGRATAALTRSSCTSTHHRAELTSNSMASTKPSRCGARSVCAGRQRASSSSFIRSFPDGRTVCSTHSRLCESRHGRRIRCICDRPSPRRTRHRPQWLLALRRASPPW